MDPFPIILKMGDDETSYVSLPECKDIFPLEFFPNL